MKLTRVWLPSLTLLCGGCLMGQTLDLEVNAGAEASAVLARHHHVVFVRQGTASSQMPAGLTPSELAEIYGFNSISNQGHGQTIGIVDAYDDPNIEADLAIFNAQFHLSACTTANGCFTKLFATSQRPVTSAGWASEIALDVEWAHAVAPAAKILLVEAPSATTQALLNAVTVAVRNHATVVSMSWGGSEFGTELASDITFQAPGVTFVASAGDNGHGTEYPAASPFVVGVGGTTLTHTSSFLWGGETVWHTGTGATGGGVSAYESEPSWQTAFQNMGHRGIPDISYDADPATGVAVYDSVGESGQRGWMQFGGTSMGAPQIAAMIAIVNASRSTLGKPALHFPAALYSFSAGFHDITVGNNGTCGMLCSASGGYDFETGLGSPIANHLVNALVSQ